MVSVGEASIEASSAAPAPLAPPLAPLLPGSLPTEGELRGIASWTQLLAMAGLSGPAALGFMEALELTPTDPFGVLAEAPEASFWQDLESWSWTQLVDGVETSVRPRTKSRGQAGIARRLAQRLHQMAMGLDKAPTPIAVTAMPDPAAAPTPPIGLPVDGDDDFAEPEDTITPPRDSSRKIDKTVIFELRLQP